MTLEVDILAEEVVAGLLVVTGVLVEEVVDDEIGLIVVTDMLFTVVVLTSEELDAGRIDVTKVEDDFVEGVAELSVDELLTGVDTTTEEDLTGGGATVELETGTSVGIDELLIGVEMTADELLTGGGATVELETGTDTGTDELLIGDGTTVEDDLTGGGTALDELFTGGGAEAELG